MSSMAVRRATRVRMVAQPASIPVVRRLVDEALETWGRADLVDDIGLTVTELATNATLHSAGNHFVVELTPTREGARLSVVDSGSMPAPLIAARADLRLAPSDPLATEPADDLDALALELESMTGRGLMIVAALASRWGIDDLSGGTRVWADFGSERSSYTVAAPELASADPAPDAAATLPVQTRVVPIELLGCPPRLLLAHDDNLADYARELALFGAGNRDRQAVEAAQQISEVVRASAVSWDAARVMARQAADEGLPVVDIAIASDPTSLPVKITVLRRAVSTAEAMSEAGLLMTLPAPGPLQAWRDWVEQEMLEQAATGRRPRPFAAGRAD